MKIRQCRYCHQEFDAQPYRMGPPRQYCSTSCRTRESFKRARVGQPDPARVLQGKIGMSERYGRHDEAEAYRAQLAALKSADE